MDVFVARHPVFGRKKEVYGYELEFRSGFNEYYELVGAEKSSVDLMAFVNFAELVDGGRGFVYFSRDLLLKKFPRLFDAGASVTGIPGDLAFDEEVIAQCRELKQSGWTLSLRGYTPAAAESQLLGLIDIAEVDFRALNPDNRAAACRQLAERGIQVLARKVDTPDAFDMAVAEGSALLQGDFFTQPVIRPGRQIASSKLHSLRLLQEVGDPDLSYEDLGKIIEQDVSLTYRLLKFMNSAWFGLRFEVNSVKHALVLLGAAEIRRWASMVAVGGAGEDKPSELLLRSLTRAKLAEQIGLQIGMKREAPELFLLGMFSVVDALLDKPMAEIMAELPLKQDVRQALVDGTGRYQPMLDVILSGERGDWTSLSRAAEGLKLDEKLLPALQRESRKWASQALKEL